MSHSAQLFPTSENSLNKVESPDSRRPVIQSAVANANQNPFDQRKRHVHFSAAFGNSPRAIFSATSRNVPSNSVQNSESLRNNRLLAFVNCRHSQS
jgi:hypothetical protein